MNDTFTDTILCSTWLHKHTQQNIYIQNNLMTYPNVTDLCHYVAKNGWK
jgi:hypothetical protein